MSLETNRSLARKYREELFSTGNLAIADQICDNNAVFHSNDPLTPDFGRGAAALKQIATMYRTAFPDAKCVIEDTISEGDKVVVRWTARGTHKGPLGSSAPTGKQVTVTGIDIFSVAGGVIKEGWTNWDTLGMLQQLGLSQKTEQAGR